MKEEVKEEVKEEETLEELIEELTDEELDKKIEETFKKDILSEDEIKLKFTHRNTAIVDGNVSTLKNREIMPIENLEEKLKEDDDENKNILESQEIIEYGIKDEDVNIPLYIKPKSNEINYNKNIKISRDELGEVMDSSSLSGELDFVRKNTKPMYTKPEKVDFNKISDNKNKFIKDFKKLSDDYKTG